MSNTAPQFSLHSKLPWYGKILALMKVTVTVTVAGKKTQGHVPLMMHGTKVKQRIIVPCAQTAHYLVSIKRSSETSMLSTTALYREHK